jgi:hypothetical protein
VYFEQWDAWVDRCVTLGKELARERGYDLVASSGPPHFAHVAAREIAAASGLPLMIDLRDPWMSDDVEPMTMRGRYWRHRTAVMERATVRRADVVIANTDSSRDLLRERYPDRAARIITVRNGSDGALVAGEASDTFTLAYAGDLYGGRDPDTLFAAVATVVRQHRLSASDLRVEILGGTTYLGTPIAQIAQRHGIVDFVTARERVPRPEALALLRRSQMLVLLPQQHCHSVPAKTFEYVQHPAWLLVFAEPGTATHELLEHSGADCVTPGDEVGAAARIAERYAAFRRGDRPAPLNADGRFDRSHQADILVRVLDELVPPGAAPGDGSIVEGLRAAAS